MCIFTNCLARGATPERSGKRGGSGSQVEESQQALGRRGPGDQGLPPGGGVFLGGCEGDFCQIRFQG